MESKYFTFFLFSLSLSSHFVNTRYLVKFEFSFYNVTCFIYIYIYMCMYIYTDRDADTFTIGMLLCLVAYITYSADETKISKV